MLNGGTLNYFAVPWGIVNNPLPLFLVVAIEVALMGAVEYYRRNGSGPAGYSPGVGKFESNSKCILLCNCMTARCSVILSAVVLL